MDASDNHDAAPASRGGPIGPLVALHLAASFLTRLPLPPAPAASFAHLAGTLWAFPVIGALIGLAAAMVYLAAAALGLPIAIAAILAVAAMTLITGGLHEDGLADSADGFGGGVDRAAKLAIMRDSRIGVFGALALILVVALKIFALVAIATAGGISLLFGLVAAAAVSRAALALVMGTLAPARDEGLGAGAGRPGPAVTIATIVIGLAIGGGALAAANTGAIAVPLAVGLATAGAVAVLARHQIGGYTGDVLGAAQQLSETAILVTLTTTIL